MSASAPELLALMSATIFAELHRAAAADGRVMSSGQVVADLVGESLEVARALLAGTTKVAHERSDFLDLESLDVGDDRVFILEVRATVKDKDVDDDGGMQLELELEQGQFMNARVVTIDADEILDCDLPGNRGRH